MKRTVFLAAALLALMAVGVYAQTEADFDVTVSKDGKSVTIDGYKGSATAVNIPARIKNLPVTIIEGSAFDSNDKITSVTIPNGVTNIGLMAFSMCGKLTNVTIPASVTNIGNQAFGACSFLTSVTFAGSIPSSGFHANAFMYIGDIRDKYFATGGGAGTYTRPNPGSTVWTKGTSAAAPAAAGTAGLKFDLTPDGKGYSVSKGTVGVNVAVIIPDSYNNLPVTQIGRDAFSMTFITSVTIPNSVTSIGHLAFANCRDLTSVTIGSGVKEIGMRAFDVCDKLTSVTFQGTIPANSINSAGDTFPGDLRAKYIAGGVGTYTRPSGGTTWTKK